MIDSISPNIAIQPDLDVSLIYQVGLSNLKCLDDEKCARTFSANLEFINAETTTSSKVGNFLGIQHLSKKIVKNNVSLRVKDRINNIRNQMLKI